MRARPTSVALAVGVAAVGLVPAAGAKAPPPAKPSTSVVNTFRAEYEATVTWTHHQGTAESNDEDTLSYTVHGTLPDVTFVNGALSVNVSGRLETSVEGTVTGKTDNPTGTSVSCSGKTVQVRGLAGIGRTRDGFWFVPWLTGTGFGDCTDSNGKPSKLERQVVWPTPPTPAAEAAPTGATGYRTTARGIDVDDTTKPFRVVSEDDKCPRYEPSRTVSCTFVAEGTLTLTRISRKEEADDTSNDDLLAPDEPPRLNRKKTKATTEVECRKACDVEALIGVFGGTRKHPKVTPIRRKKVRLKANRATTISLPVNAAARAAAKRGRLVMTLRATGGKRQIYPLT